MPGPVLSSPLVPPTTWNCPTCLRPVKRPDRCKELFRVLVCRKCRDGFANRREAAYLIDCLVLYVLATGIARGLAMLENKAPPHIAELIFILSGLVQWPIMPLLFTLKDGIGGRSPGKRLFGIQVVDAVSREPIAMRQSFKRNLIFMLPWIGTIGGVITLMKGRRWGDGWAKTEVVWLKYKTRPPFAPAGQYCRTCGYDLTGNVSGRCPECGVAIPPDQTVPATPPTEVPLPG